MLDPGDSLGTCTCQRSRTQTRHKRLLLPRNSTLPWHVIQAASDLRSADKRGTIKPAAQGAQLEYENLIRFTATTPLTYRDLYRPMKKQDRANYILRRLGELYPTTEVPLQHHDPFTLLVAVVLSAQCTDKRVNEVTPGLFAKADDPAAMAGLRVAQIKKCIQTCGLADQKAKAIRGLSRILVDRYDGQVPDTFEALETLPGVGHKTASVVMSQAFGKAAFPVDTHIHRLAQRWGLTSGKSVVQTERDLKRQFPEDTWNRLHLQFIFYGREHCTARGCNGTVCEICRVCYPTRRKPVTTQKA